jgi:chromosome segregation ATPase
MDVLERECANYQLEISSLKAKLKETRAGQEEAQEKDDLIRELKAKFEKSINRATALNRELAESREEEEQASARNRTLSKRNKDL